MRRFSVAALLVLFIGQSSGVVLAGTSGLVREHASSSALGAPLTTVASVNRVEPASPMVRHTPLPRRPMANYADPGRYARLVPKPHALPKEEHVTRPIDLTKLRRARFMERQISPHALGVKRLQMNLSGASLGPQGASLTTPVTGLLPWWSYESHTIPGLGLAMVNLSTLNFLIAESDLDISAGELDLSFQRLYNSESKHNATNDDGSTPSVFGNRWTNNLDVHLGWSSTGQNTGIISVYTADGARDDYACEIDIVETCTSQMPGIYDLLGTTNVSGGVACQIQWTQKSGVTYTFNAPYAACGNGAGSYGRLTRVYGRNQSYYLKLVYSWSPNDSNPGNLSQIAVTHQPDGTQLTLIFGQIANTNITELMSISRPDGQTLNYHYSSGGELVDVDKPGNNPILPSGGHLPKTFLDGNPIATGNLPETYDIESPGMMEVCGPRATISIIMTKGNPTDGACVDFDYVNHQLSDWYTRGVLNPTPDDSVVSLPLQSGPSQGFVQWNDTTFF